MNGFILKNGPGELKACADNCFNTFAAPDLSAFADYLLEHQARRPPVRCFEWFAASEQLAAGSFANRVVRGRATAEVNRILST